MQANGLFSGWLKVSGGFGHAAIFAVQRKPHRHGSAVAYPAAGVAGQAQLRIGAYQLPETCPV